MECTFKHSSAEIGGAIVFYYSAALIKNSAFIKNYMANNKNDSSCRGGALYFYIVNAYEVIVHNCSFVNNTEPQRAMHTMYSSGGGAITVVGELSPTIYFINPSQPRMVITLSVYF